MKTLTCVELIGIVGTKPVVRKSKQDNFVTFRLATKSTALKDGLKVSKTDWHTIIAQDKLARFIINNVQPGMLLYVAGRFQVQHFIDEEGLSRQVIQVFAAELITLPRQKPHRNPITD